MNKLLFCIALIISQSGLFAQTQLTEPEVSQAASVNQRIGITDMKIEYHSPLTKGRVIWGNIVPYDEVWRAGANQNTTISFSSDVKVEGKALSAGTYGLHMIPANGQWTIIFSKDAEAWGSFFYKEANDALRVKVTPAAAPNQDWLSYNFTEPKEQSVIVRLNWEKISVPFKVEVNVPETVVKNMRKELTNINGFFWQGYNQAAAYSLRNNLDLTEAYNMAVASVNIQKNFINLNTQAKILEKQGKKAEADALHKEALPLADETQLNAYGYQLMGAGSTKEALEIFRINAKKYPNSWNVYDSLAEALDATGDKKGALENYKVALTKAPENQKKRLERTIKSF